MKISITKYDLAMMQKLIKIGIKAKINSQKSIKSLILAFLPILFTFQMCSSHKTENTEKHANKITIAELKSNFQNPPPSSRPGVYWYFMDGNLSKKGMTEDLLSMKEAGIGSVLFLEVNVGIPRGKVDFMSEEWQGIFTHAVNECGRLGIEFTLGIGPGWAGSGGPWVKPEESMKHLVYSSVNVTGPSKQEIILPLPEPRKPYFGEGIFTGDLKKQWQEYYEDLFVLAFPASSGDDEIPDIDEKALYYRAPYSSTEGVKPFLPEPFFPLGDTAKGIKLEDIKDLSALIQNDSILYWDVPGGKWTVMRFGQRNNGAVTRPAPMPGLGFECDKFDTVALNNHFKNYVGKLLQVVGKTHDNPENSWSRIHSDSWEMGSQNWGANFRNEFKRLRGYDPLLYFPVYSGLIVENREISERFLWDIRKTAHELIIANHAEHMKKLGRMYGLDLSIEPYDMNPCSDLGLGAVADIPMCEFWSKGYGFNTSYSCFEASSIASVLGLPVVAAEAFTAQNDEGWKLFPGALKNQGDWAFCTGINRFYYHTFAHKPFDDQYLPGMTMGPYGVHWDRGQTWWSMASSYHNYISRCSYLLQQGQKVADILYLTPEGAPHVFLPPRSALEGNDTIPDHKGYNFDGCSPEMLITLAGVKNGKIIFPGGANYQILVLPGYQTMNPELLSKIKTLIHAGAIVVGNPPVKSPGLVNYPLCDQDVKQKAEEIWGKNSIPEDLISKKFGLGTIFYGKKLINTGVNEIYPDYSVIADLLDQLNVPEDFTSNGPIRYIHKSHDNTDIYFVSNRSDQVVNADCYFRTVNGIPELWDPLTSEIRYLPEYKKSKFKTLIPLHFDAYQSYFIVFNRNGKISQAKKPETRNFPELVMLRDLSGEWDVTFDPKWGGPEKIVFTSLDDWSKRPEKGIKYYSGTAKYMKSFNMDEIPPKSRIYLDLGEVNVMAQITLNSTDLGTLWTSPWRTDITGIVKTGNNDLEINVVNLWVNRLIGDEHFPDDGIKNKEWPEWLLQGLPRTSGRYTFTTYKHYTKDSPLLTSGLTGPVKIMISSE